MAWFDISLETANEFYSWGWRGSIIGAVITAISVIFLMWGTRIRDFEAEQQMKLANYGVEQANLRASSLEETAKNAQEEQKNLRNSNIKLQEQVDNLRKPRRISEIAVTRLKKILINSGAHSFQLIYVGMDPEAQSLAEQLNSIFISAGWSLIGQVQPQIDLTGPLPVGVQFGVKSQQDLPSALIPFIDLMREEKLIGARASVGLAPELPDNQSIAVRVGHKPSQ